MTPVLDIDVASSGLKLEASAGSRRYVATAAQPERFSYHVRPTPRLTLSWQRVEDGWTVHDVHTGIFGFGESLNDAILDVRRALREHKDVLERQGRLSQALQDHLNYLRARI